EPASLVRDDNQGEACPTDSGFIANQDRATIAKSFTLPHDSAPRVKLKERVKLLEDKEGEKSHYMVKEGIVLGHKISKNGIKVDKAKVDVIAKLPHPTNVKVENQVPNSEPVVAPVVEPIVAPTERALIDVYKGELNHRVGKEAVTFNLDQTSRYSANYDAMSVNRIDLFDVTCEVYSQEVLRFSMSGNPTPSTEPIVSTSFFTLTSFGDSDFLLEETDAFLAIDDEPISPKIDESYYDSEGDIILLEEFLNDYPSSLPLPPQELKVVEPTNEKSSINEPPVVELKDLPPHLEYAFLEGDDKFPVIISKDLKDEEKTSIIKVLKSHKQALAWQLFDIKGINLEFYTHKILIEDDFKPAVQHQRRVNPKIYEVIKKEVLKLLDAGLIYPISDSP
nr:reverse transcriptase domain-containing protein [Tanacetum cinerariifolium]